MKAILMALVITLLPFKPEPEGEVMKRAAKAAEAAAYIVSYRIGDVKNPTNALRQRETWARIMFVFAYYEASWYASPKGSNDEGRACGVLQVHNPEKYVTGYDCKSVRGSLEKGFDVGLALMMRLEKQCGSKKAALTAYATDGACHNWTLPLVVKRCKEAGLTEECELPLKKAA